VTLVESPIEGTQLINVERERYVDSYQYWCPSQEGIQKGAALFPTMAELFVWSAILGYAEGQYQPIRERHPSSPFRWLNVRQRHQHRLIMMAIASIGSFDVLNHPELIRQDIENHSNAGLLLMHKELALDRLAYQDIESLIFQLQKRIPVVHDLEEGSCACSWHEAVYGECEPGIGGRASSRLGGFHHKELRISMQRREGLSQSRDDPLSSDEALDSLEAELKDADPEVRSGAVEALGGLSSPKAVQLLIDALQDAAPSVRRLAAQALGNSGDSQAIQPLTILSRREGDVDVRASAVEALAALRDLHSLSNRSSENARPRSRRDASQTVDPHPSQSLADASLFSVLIGALQDVDKYEEWSAASLLSEIGNAAEVETLVGDLEEGADDVRRNAARALRDYAGAEALLER
jgi:hypothetical protein